VASGPLSATFSTVAKRLATQQVYSLNFLNNFLLGYTKNAKNQRGFSKRYLPNSQLIKAYAVNEAIHNVFRNGWF